MVIAKEPQRWVAGLLTALVVGTGGLCSAEEAKTREVVATGTRTEQEIKDVPVAVAVITAEELAAQRQF